MNNKIMPKIDKNFYPMAIKLDEMKQATIGDAGKEITIGILRTKGGIYTYSARIFSEKSGRAGENFTFCERLVKTLLWIAGGFRIYFAGDEALGEKIKAAYKKGGLREFDVDFFETVYERPFEVVVCKKSEIPENNNANDNVGINFSGCRIGFDAGGSDRKVSAVIDGNPVYSEEVVWNPKLEEDPSYHFSGIYEAFKTAAQKLPHVDAIGVSTAGVVVDDRPMVSSLFIKVPKEKKREFVYPIYLNCAKKLSEELGYNVPIRVANDGDVTALAGAISMNCKGILGVAMGTSEAGGYVDENGNITGLVNELAFVPIDFNPLAMVDEWSGDIGCGVKYFSQDGVIKLAGMAGISFESGLTPAEKLKIVQKMLENEDAIAKDIFADIGIYFGYGIAYYAEFYNISHVLILGRVTSGSGGEIILQNAKKVLENEFPEIAKHIELHLPDEKFRRVGQSVAAASIC